MDSIKINNGEVLILKTDMAISPKKLYTIREKIIDQIDRDGVAIIPSGFSYSIWNRDCIEQKNTIKRETRIINNCKAELLFDTDRQAYLVSSELMEVFLDNFQKIQESKQ